jgi:hypothetical protein
MVIAEGASDSLLPLLWTVDAGLVGASRLARAAQPAVLRLRLGAARFDPGIVEDAASRLAGLGPGLTPAGDDFLTGFAAAWRLSGEAVGDPVEKTERILKAILAGSLERSSELGDAWLRHAVHGEVAEPMGRFFAALFGGEPSDLMPSVRETLRLGATSGTDWFVGALFGIDAVLAAASRPMS